MTNKSTSDDAPRHGPLHGVRVLDLSSLIFGPLATQALGDMGADVIKVEPPEGDKLRKELKHRNREKGHMGSVFMALNRNKRSIMLDLKDEGDRQVLRELVADSDVFIHNIRSSAMDDLGFGYDVVSAINPSIVYVHCAGYGSDGPYAGRQATEDLIQGASGAVDSMRDEDGARLYRMLPGLFVDKICGLHALYAILAALFHRERAGEGQFVEVPMLECFTSFLMVEHLYGATFEPPAGGVGAMSVITGRRAHKSADGYIAVLPQGQAASAKFLELGGFPGFYETEEFVAADSKGRIAAYNAAMRDAAKTRTTEEWMELGEIHRVGIMRVNFFEDVLDDPHLKAVNFFDVRSLDGGQQWRAVKPPINFARTPASIRHEPPNIGAHSEQVLAEIDARRAS